MNKNLITFENKIINSSSLFPQSRVFFSSIHRGRTRQLYSFCFFPLSADARKFLKRAARATASEFFFLGIPSHSLDFPQNVLKF